MEPGEPTSAGGPEPEKKPSSRERDLIQDALNQVRPKDGSKGVTFAGDIPAEGTFPGYEVLREIHRGGQGVVYQAIQRTTLRKVAIKVLHGGPFTGSTGRSRFEREVQILGQLTHSNIVRIHDSGVSPDGSFFYVMDYISGRSLDELIADKRPSIDETLALFIKICDAINAAHLKGIIHRDIKPSNIRVDANGEPIIVDFGLAKIAVPEAIEGNKAESPQLMTLTGQFIGSLPWASPEQAEGMPGNIDVRTDVYSLGVVLYQMLTGKFPYKVIGHMRDVLDNILRAEPAKPSTIRRQINDEVETIVLKCLHKDRDRRYQSAGELGRDLKRYLGGQPIEAKRDSTAYMLGKTLKRYRVQAGVGAAFAVLVVASSVAGWVLYRQAAEAKAETDAALVGEREATQQAQAQADRAERNFRAGHELAMVMITQIEPELDDLRGGTKAREIVLKEAQAYLDRLKTEAGDDPDLLLDLARAHERVGDLQGVIYMRRLGETAQADVNFARAREIRERLATTYPQDPRMIAALARSQYRTAGALALKRETARARQEFEASVAGYDAALKLGAGREELAGQATKWAEDRAWTVRALGDMLLRQGQAAMQGQDAAGGRQLIQEAEQRLDEAAGHWRARMSADPKDAEAARALGVVADERAKAMVASARGIATSAKKLREQGREADALAQFDAALERLEQARAGSLAAGEEFAKLLAADNTNAELRRDQWLVLHNVGVTHSEAAEVLRARSGAAEGAPPDGAESAAREQALGYYSQATAIARRLGDEDTRSLEARRDLALCLNKVGNEQRALRRFPDAWNSYHESAQLRQAIQAADPLQRHHQDLALGCFKMGQVEKEWAMTEQGEARKSRLASAAGWAGRALALFQELQQQGVLDEKSPFLSEPRQLVREIEGLQTDE